MKNEVKHTAHFSYRCEYHIVFAPKHRRKVIYKELREDIGEIFCKLCKEMKIEIIEAQACADYIHMLVNIPLHMSISQFVGILESKSALMIFGRHANLKYRYGSRSFWARGYFVDTVGKNERLISNYIGNQLEKDYAKAPSAWMERHSRRCIPRGVVIFSVATARFSQETFFSTISLGLVGSLARQHWGRHGQPSQLSQRYHTFETSCPFWSSVHSFRSNKRRPFAQVK